MFLNIKIIKNHIIYILLLFIIIPEFCFSQQNTEKRDTDFVKNLNFVFVPCYFHLGIDLNFGYSTSLGYTYKNKYTIFYTYNKAYLEAINYSHYYDPGSHPNYSELEINGKFNFSSKTKTKQIPLPHHNVNYPVNIRTIHAVRLGYNYSQSIMVNSGFMGYDVKDPSKKVNPIDGDMWTIMDRGIVFTGYSFSRQYKMLRAFSSNHYYSKYNTLFVDFMYAPIFTYADVTRDYGGYFIKYNINDYSLKPRYGFRIGYSTGFYTIPGVDFTVESILGTGTGLVFMLKLGFSLNASI